MKKICLLPLCLLFFACHNPSLGSKEFKGVVTDLTGLDGCGMIIYLDNGTNLQPAELPQGFVLQKNKRVKLRYILLKDRMSTCMRGSMAKITSINYL